MERLLMQSVLMLSGAESPANNIIFSSYQVSDEDVLAVLPKIRSENPYELAMHYQNLAAVLQELSARFANLADAQIESIRETGLKHILLMLNVEDKVTREVDAEKLKQNRPDVYRQLVSLKSSDAEKLIGKKKLYDYAVECSGADAVSKYEIVLLGSLEKCTDLSKHEKAAYIIENHKEGICTIINR